MPNIVDITISARNALLPGLAAAQADIEGWTRDAQGRFHDANGRFVGEGRQAGRGYSGGMIEALQDGLKPLAMILSTGFVMPAAAAAGAAAAAFASAGAAVGAFALAVKPQLADVAEVVKAYDKSQEESASKSEGSARRIADAQRQLSAAVRNAAEQHEDALDGVADAEQRLADAQRGVKDAQKDLTEARKDAKKNLEELNQRVDDATWGVEDAAIALAEAKEQYDRVADAEGRLTEAQEDAKRAQEDLNDARRDAARDLQDLSGRVEDSQLGVREATLRLTEAQEDYNKILGDTSADDDQREKAAIRLAQAERGLERQTQGLERAREAEAEAAEAGVEGSEKVLNAKEKLADAQKAVTEAAENDEKAAAARAVAEAQRRYDQQVRLLNDLLEQQKAAQKAGVEGSDGVVAAKDRIEEANRRLAESEKALAEARRNVAKVDQQAADAIAAARSAVAAASTSAASATETYEEKLAKLNPASRETARALIAMKEELKSWSDGLSDHTMPVFTDGINILRTVIPMLTPLVEAAADAFHEFLGGIKSDVEGGGLTSFIQSMADAARETLPDFLNSAKNIAIGIGGLISAFLPFSGTVTGGIEDATAAFAKWGQGLKDSQGFKNFIGYVREAAPIVMDFLKRLADTGLEVAKGFGPLAGVGLEVAENLGKILQALPEEWLNNLVPVIAGIVVAVKAWSIAQGLLNIVMLANPIVLAAAALIALGAGLVYAYKHSETFRDIVNEAWRSISEAVMPIIEQIWKTIKEDLVPAFMDLVDALEPVVAWFLEQMVPYVREAFASFMMIIQGAVNIVTGIIKVFTGILTGDWKKVWEGLGQIVDGALQVVSGIIRQAVNSIATIWRVGWGALTKITENVGEGMRNAASGIANGFVDGISTAWRWIGNALGWLRDRIFGFFSGASGWLSNAGQWMVYGLADGIYKVASWVGNALRDIIPDFLEGYIPGFAHGGIIGAAGGGPRSGLVLVGEQGPELVRMAPGSTVIPHGATRSMLEGGGQGGSGGGTLYLDSAGSRMDDLLVELLRMAIRDRGGDVQVVLGRS